jgi:hypothetical protein
VPRRANREDLRPPGNEERPKEMKLGHLGMPAALSVLSGDVERSPDICTWFHVLVRRGRRVWRQNVVTELYSLRALRAAVGVG